MTMNTKLNLLKSLKGFSLPEVLVSVVIFAVLIAAISSVLMVGEASWQTNQVQIEIIQDMRKAVSTMENELRQTASSAIMEGPTVADGVPSTSITFYMPNGVSGGAISWNADTTQYFLGEDLDDDGTLDAGEDINNNGMLDVPEDANSNNTLDGGEDINGDGKLNGGPIIRIEGSDKRVIANNIQSLNFSRGAGTPDIIDVTLSVQKETVKGRSLSLNFAFEVQMRN